MADYELIQTAKNSSGSVTFSNIPQTYRQLVVIAYTEDNVGYKIYYNSRTSDTHYYSRGTTTGATSTTTGTYTVQSNLPYGAGTSFFMTIPNYADNLNYVAWTRLGNSNSTGYMEAVQYTNAEAVTSLTFVASGTGSTNQISLYGVM